MNRTTPRTHLRLIDCTAQQVRPAGLRTVSVQQQAEAKLAELLTRARRGEVGRLLVIFEQSQTLQPVVVHTGEDLDAGLHLAMAASWELTKKPEQ